MRRTLVALAATAIALTTTAVRADLILGSNMPADHTQPVTRSAGGGVCYDGPAGEFRCRFFGVSETVNVLDGSRETRLEYGFQRSGAEIWGYRYLNCPVDRKALNVTPNRATFNAEVVDPTAGSCSNWGYLCDADGCRDWLWTDPVIVKGEMTTPGYERTYVTSQQDRDNDSGVSTRAQCHGGGGERIHGGGVSFSTTGGNFLYFPFGSVGPYGQADGAYMYETCNFFGD